jgi:hypothetical protein
MLLGFRINNLGLGRISPIWVITGHVRDYEAVLRKNSIETAGSRVSAAPLLTFMKVRSEWSAAFNYAVTILFLGAAV